ncbi:putative alcohol O-acetyltransferase [Helianthus annuus]|uniref:Alcohol O-acetyltransferase n=1 Tax=Helianthus annuus TaxID=4232 RepID=A0A251U9B3_HELAN|nr:putative alcohol O-acetyltransferase [Helianthus annuus]KAJ0874898.1 putative alcohol O-acetyltransferase [Helianthus annuus]
MSNCQSVSQLIAHRRRSEMESTGGDVSPYELLFKGLTLIPVSLYLLIAFLIFLIFAYNLLEFHIIHDIFSAFGGNHVSLTCDFSSDLYREVVSKCHLLHGRYLSTPWLSSPHLQTMLLHLLVKTHNFTYKRELFISSDGGTIALDWLMNFDETKFQVNGDNFVAKAIPLVIVIPGLTSDSDSPYIKHAAYKMAKHGWNVVISNHRGLGGVPPTSDCIYTAGWTEDLREVVNHLHCTHPEAPLFAIGTSLGANILVKYLGEDNAPLVGGASICNPWDILMGDRFFGRGLMQRFYNIILANALKDVAKLHRAVYARIADWEGIEKTVDTFHRWASSVRVVNNVKIPLVCINAIDDPVCSHEAIPFDECRMNKNIVVATTQHGGHNAFFEGMSGKNLWWVRVIEEYFSVLHSSSLMNKNTGATALRNN